MQELMYNSKGSAESHVEKVCKKMTKRCAKSKTYSPTKYVRKDEEFVGISEKDLEMEKMMAELKGMGMGGSMYGKDDMASMMDGYGGYGDEGVPGMDDEYEL